MPAPTPAPMHFEPLGDSAVVIRLGTTVDEATHRRVRALCSRLEACEVPGVVEHVPAFASVTVHYDPAAIATGGAAGDSPYRRLVGALRRALDGTVEAEPPPSRVVEIPVCYGGELGPDLEEVARHHGLAPEQVVRIHAGGDYLVHMIGFAPGFPYLGGMDPRIATPRRPAPRTRVPAGSVGIGGAQTGIYSIDSPGGWHLIGRTPLRLFDAGRDPAALLRMGDRVRFRPIGIEAFRDQGAG